MHRIFQLMLDKISFWVVRVPYLLFCIVPIITKGEEVNIHYDHNAKQKAGKIAG